MPSSMLLLAILTVFSAGCSSYVAPAYTTSPTPTSPTAAPAAPTFRLSGLVSEATDSGVTPVVGAEVEVGVCPPLNRSPVGYRTAVTNEAGFYSVSDMCAGQTYVWVAKDGYETHPPSQCDGDCLFATIAGDTEFNIQLFRKTKR